MIGYAIERAVRWLVKRPWLILWGLVFVLSALVFDRWFTQQDTDADRRSRRAAIAERDSIIASDRAWLRRDVARADSLTRAAQAADARALAAEQRALAVRGRVTVVGPVVLATPDSGEAQDTLATDARVAQALVAQDSALAACADARRAALVALDTSRQALSAAQHVIAQQDTALALRDTLLRVRPASHRGRTLAVAAVAVGGGYAAVKAMPRMLRWLWTRSR